MAFGNTRTGQRLRDRRLFGGLNRVNPSCDFERFYAIEKTRPLGRAASPGEAFAEVRVAYDRDAKNLL